MSDDIVNAEGEFLHLSATENSDLIWAIRPGSDNVIELADSCIDVLIKAVKSLPSDECEIFVAQLGAAASRVAPTAIAYPHRSTAYIMNIQASNEGHL